MVKTKVNEMVLHDFMVKNNLSQRDLAAQLGVSAGYVCQLLCGARRPSPRLRRRMLAVLSLSFDELFCIENHPLVHTMPAPLEPALLYSAGKEA